MKEFDAKHAKANGYTRKDWDAVESPEVTDKQFTGMKPFREAAPELAKKFEAEIARRGRPPIANPKVAVSIRMDPDLLEALKADGKGWQTRANDLLRKAVGL